MVVCVCVLFIITVVNATVFGFTMYHHNDVCLSVDTPDETDKSLPEDDLQKNLAFLLDRVEGCSVHYLFVAISDSFFYSYFYSWCSH